MDYCVCRMCLGQADKRPISKVAGMVFFVCLFLFSKKVRSIAPGEICPAIFNAEPNGSRLAVLNVFWFGLS